jgi:hypothetical protein
LPVASIQLYALCGIKGNSTPRYFDPSVFSSFVNQLPTKIETSLVSVVTLTCFMFVSAAPPGVRKDGGVQLTWEQLVLVRVNDQPVGNPKRKV